MGDDRGKIVEKRSLGAVPHSEADVLSNILQIIGSMEEFDAVEFVIFHGSRSRRMGTKTSDLDICIYYRGVGKDLSRFRLKLISKLPGYCDVQMFQQLPLYIRKEVIAEKVIYVKNKRFLYDLALKTIRDFESFKPRYYDYIYR